ncbi:hypothetical protein V1512DRAFT_261490 [Lipomyces arxii]|uniref:uncharacterized protein n=1 Tax=Lipomyces arxii TaxID=56418 RepID=UPI0034CE14C0
MGFLIDHPYTAITVTIERLVSDQFEEDDVAGVFDLIETIRLSPTGPTEAARALRKKLKYGSVHNQLRALTILDCLIENGGKRFQSSFADEPLLERMRVIATDSFTDPEVKKKMSRMFVAWANKYKDTQGMHEAALLYRQLPQKKRAPAKPQRFLDYEDDEEDTPPPQPARPGAEASASRSDNSSRGPSLVRDERERRTRAPSIDRINTPIRRSDAHSDTVVINTAHGSKTRREAHQLDLEKEKPKLLQTLAEAGTAATNLANSLKLINREKELAINNIDATANFNKCKHLRRQILKYIQHIESEDYIGSLIHANEELVAALQLYDRMSQPVEDDSDSEYDDSESEDEVVPSPRSRTVSPDGHRLKSAYSGAHSSSRSPSADALAHKRKPPPIPVKSPLLQEFKANLVIKDEEEESNPFGDFNKIETPAVEKSGMSWN